MNLKKSSVFFSLLFIPFCLAQSNYMFACIDDYSPYQYIGPPPHGIHITALKNLANTLNKEIQFIESPNIARCVRMLKNGDVDVIAGLNINEERKEFAFYAPYKILEDHVILSNGSNKISDYQSLQGKIIGVPRGTSYFKKFDEDNSLKKISIQNNKTGIELLLKKRIDVIIVSKSVAKTLIADVSKVQLKTTVLEQVDHSNKMSYFGFSKLNQLNLPQNEIIKQTTQAFKQGKFRTK
ncbi:MAG: transporter substrate-binding domain-containing protein [Colwellia sp.]|nr:transporter substrate-binding domain-containing protein [Colwellia sp.]